MGQGRAPTLFPPAFTDRARAERAEIDAIAERSEPPTFANTIAALEDAGRHQDRAETAVRGDDRATSTTPEVQAVDREWSPKLAAADDEITFNDKLFARDRGGPRRARDAGLTAEQQRLVERTYDRFVRAGARS